MDLLAILIRKIFFPAWSVWRGNRHLLRYIHKFDFLDQCSVETLAQRQFSNLRTLLIHAGENTTYYRDLFAGAGFSPQDMTTPDDIGVLPLLTKLAVREHQQELIAGNYDRSQLKLDSTGGSTGMPMQFYRDQDCLYLRRGQELFFERWMGYQIGEKTALFVASSHHENSRHKLKAAIRNATNERLLRFDPHHITDEYMQEYAEEFVKFRPRFIKSFPNSLTAFADFIQRKSLPVPRVQSISCTGENLYAGQRELFSEIFGGEIFEKYGTKECGVIACECTQHHGLHVFSEGVYLEIIDEQGLPVKPGEMGRIVVTDLFNKGMPLIRYEIGDLGIAAGDERCACGSNLPRIGAVVGRDRDIIYDGAGNPKPGYLFVEVIDKVGLPVQVQVIQLENRSLLIVIASMSPDEVGVATLKAGFSEIVGAGTEIEFEYRGHIERDPSGKFCYVTSRYKRPG